jgi:hypothetical protein
VAKEDLAADNGSSLAPVSKAYPSPAAGEPEPVSASPPASKEARADGAALEGTDAKEDANADVRHDIVLGAQRGDGGLLLDRQA